jgi:hypothetical protein
MDPTPHQQSIAKALTTLDQRLTRLITALAHSSSRVRIEGATTERQALARVCEAYAAIDYAMEDDPNASVTCPGTVGVSPDILRRAQAVNEAKEALRALCVPLQRVRKRIPVKGIDGPTKAIPLIRVILRSLQRSNLNLLAAYRKIPILAAPPHSVTYTKAHTRAVYRKTIHEIEALLAPLQGPKALADRARLGALPRSERHLALVRGRYENIRANIVYARLDPKGRGRVQRSAELPLLYPIGRSEAPQVQFPPSTPEASTKARTRQSRLDPEPFLQSLPVYRYRKAD